MQRRSCSGILRAGPSFRRMSSFPPFPRQRRRPPRIILYKMEDLKDIHETDRQDPEDTKYMKAALKQAEKAIALGEVPIGAVIVYDGRIIARGYNRRNTDKTTLAHAEITCIKKACKKTGDWRLEGCTLYCTLEPCQMCAGAIVQSRIDRVVIGTDSPKSGCGGTLLNILQNPDFNHQVRITRDVLREDCTEILQRFFRDLRRRNKERKKMLRLQARP